jgi:hypothetical protein
MDMNHRRAWAGVLGLLWTVLTSHPSHGHADPRGDVHPAVIAAPGVFQVCFYTAEPNPGPFAVEVWFRTLHKPDGTLIAPRHRVIDKGQLQALEYRLWNKYAQGKDHQATIEWTSISPTAFEEGRPVPSRLVLRTLKNGTFHEEPLFLDASGCSDLTSQLVGEKWAALLWGSIKQAEDGRSQDTTLKFTWFARDSAAEPVTRELGACATVYDFVRASNLVWAGERIWVAWVRVIGEAEERSWETTLTSFDPSTGNISSKALPGMSNWNTTLSLAATDGWLCAAWHCSKDGTYPGEAVIVTAFEKLPPER